MRTYPASIASSSRKDCSDWSTEPDSSMPEQVEQLPARQENSNFKPWFSAASRIYSSSGTRSFALTEKPSYAAKEIEEDNRFLINSLDTFKESSFLREYQDSISSVIRINSNWQKALKEQNT